MKKKIFDHKVRLIKQFYCTELGKNNMGRNICLSLQNLEYGSFLRFLTIKLAPVLVNVKPAVLVGMSSHKNICDYRDLWLKNKNALIAGFSLSYMELKNCRQVFFYDSNILFKVLSRRAVTRFLCKFGYFDCVALDDYLNVLAKRFNSEQFPHEIGIFLGYPLKDVQGFLEYPVRKPVKSGRWKVFGETEPSIHFMNIFAKAETMFTRILKNQRDPMLFLKHLNIYFKKKMFDGREKKFLGKMFDE